MPRKNRGRPSKERIKGVIPANEENITKGTPPAPYEPLKTAELQERIAENNKPENKARILKERPTLTPMAKAALVTTQEPAEGSNAFYLRYGVFYKKDTK